MTFTNKTAGAFTVASWREALVTDVDGTGTTTGDAYYPDRGVTRADVSYTYTGDIEGTSTLTYLISYMAGGSAPVVGFEHFEGSIAGHEGTCVFRHVGTQDAGTVSLRLDVVAGLGTGGLAGLRGEGDVKIAGHCDNGYPLTLGFDVD